MTELFSINFVIFFRTIFGCSCFISAPETRLAINPIPRFMFLVGFLVILKDINVIPRRYKIHNWLIWLPIEAILCLVMTEFVTFIIWYRIEEILELFVRRVLLENDTTLYYDAGGDGLVNFMLIGLSGGFLLLAVFITNTHVTLKNLSEGIIDWVIQKSNTAYNKFTAAEFTNTCESHPEENAAVVNPRELEQREMPVQCISLCAPGLFERCGEGSAENNLSNIANTSGTHTDRTPKNVRSRVPRKI